MTQSLNVKLKASYTDAAYELLSAKGSPMYYNDLIKEVLMNQNHTMDPARIAEVLTQINLDTRFSYQGNGEWGLKGWTGMRPAKKSPTVTMANKEPVDEQMPPEELDLLDDTDDEYDSELDEDLDEGLNEESEEDSEPIFPKDEEYDALKDRSLRTSWR